MSVRPGFTVHTMLLYEARLVSVRPGFTVHTMLLYEVRLVSVRPGFTVHTMLLHEVRFGECKAMFYCIYNALICIVVCHKEIAAVSYSSC